MTQGQKTAELGMMLRGCAIIGACIFVMSFFIRMPLMGAAVFAGMTAFPAAAWYLMVRRSAQEYRCFEMSEEYGRYVGGRRNTRTFRYGRIRRAIVSGEVIELRGDADVIQVIAAPEDFSFVRDYILERLPESVKAEIR